jgi:hypothetical protein
MNHSRVVLIARAEALELGYNDLDIRRRLRGQTWHSLGRGTYLTSEPPRAPEALYRLVVAAAASRLSDDSVISHQAAAVLHGIPLWRVPRRQVHVTRRGRSRSRTSGTLYTHPAGPAFDVVEVDGLPVVGAARTVVDLARTLPFEEGVVAADGALHRKIVTAAELADEVRAAKWRTGAARAAAVVAFADGESESVGESRSRVIMRRGGLPAPKLQVVVRDTAHAEIGRCDFGYTDIRVAAEFDGRVKYGRLLRPGSQDRGQVPMGLENGGGPDRRVTA